MTKLTNIFLLFIISAFFLTTYKFYSSKKNVDIKNFNRNNIESIISKKTLNLPVLKNNTNNVIEFNDGLQNNKKNKSRSFWNLLKSE